MGKEINEAAVWQRVTAASRSAGPEAPVHAPVSPGLLELLTEQRGRAAALQRLCRQTGKAAYQQLLRQERQRGAALAGLYYLMTERSPKPAEKTFSAGGPELLRLLLRSLETSAGRMEALAEKTGGETARTLGDLCRQTRQSWNALLELLGESLR